MRINEYNERVNLNTDDALLVDGNTEGTGRITAENAPFAMLSATDFRNRRMIFRGKYLGTEITVEQRDNIANGSFKDLWLGDYWTIGDMNWRICDFDYWYSTKLSSSNGGVSKHHLVIMPDTCLPGAVTFWYNPIWSTDSTSGGYYHCAAPESAGTSWAINKIRSIFGSDVVSAYFIPRRTYAVTDISQPDTSGSTSDPTKWIREVSKSYFQVQIDLPTEVMLFGRSIYTIHNTGMVNAPLPPAYTTEPRQLALFAVAPEYLGAGQRYPLKDAVNLYRQSAVDAYGFPITLQYASSDYKYIRPVFAYGRQ